MYQRYKLAAICLLAVMTGAVYAAEITDIMVRQRWPWSRKVDIEYVLECTTGGKYDIEIKAYNGEVPLSLPMGSLSGDIYNVRDGAHRIVWDPTLTPYVDNGVITNFRVDLTLTPTPLYMIVDLTKTGDNPEQIQYVYEDEIINGDWGTWERNPVSNDNIVIESVIWTGLTNDIYKTTKLVLRRIPATGSNGYLAGSPTTEGRRIEEREEQVQMILTKPFYIGVFEVTQYQWAEIMDAGIYKQWPSFFTNTVWRDMRPVETVSYNMIRGDNLGAQWPGVDGKGDYRVDDTSFMGRLRDKTGNKYTFDLPTDAQWEWACRAGTTGAHNVPDAPLDELGRYYYNGGAGSQQGDGPEKGTAIVGTHLPNAWGLYDMHGNVAERCLDWRCDDPIWKRLGGQDPVGAVGGTERILRSSGYSGDKLTLRSAYVASQTPSSRSSNQGFRLVMHLCDF